MRVAFRTDASLQIGTGHVMRCLTLAKALAAGGAECEFMCREHPGNLLEFIRGQGFPAHPLPLLTKTARNGSAPETAHGHWLGASQSQDAAACRPILAERVPDWLITDHYALDSSWERALAPHYRKLLVIDDLADRTHACDALLDQTLGRATEDYTSLVPGGCQLLCGSSYALLRPEFAALRSYSLQRRAQPVLRELLITMGGVDKDNATGQILKALYYCPLPRDCQITVVMGATAPWLDEVHKQAREMPWPTRVLVGVSNMAQLMADSDLAIGAAGATSWERCCLGVPTIMLVLADNQRGIAEALTQAGAAYLLDSLTLDDQRLIGTKHLDPLSLCKMSVAAAAVTDGLGVVQVAEILTKEVEHANQLAV